MKIKIIALGVVFASVAAAYVFVASPQQMDALDNASLSKNVASKKTSDVQSGKAALPASIERKAPAPVESTIQQFVELLKQQVGENITDVVVQVGLKEFRDGLQSEYPQKGAEIFEQIIRTAFPELADQILATVLSMDAYDEWLVANYLDLNDMNPIAKDNSLWAKRIELFGEDNARKIWSEEIAEDVRRERAVRTVVSELNQAYDMSMSDRVYTLQAVMQENFGNTAEGALIGTGNVTAKIAFQLDSVQRELAAMPEDQRQTAINEMRRQLGYPEERIEEMASFDQERNSMWEKGTSYMKEREALLSSYQGDDLETELDLLRLKHFDDRHAYTLKQEESIGMMRYERKRLYGLN